MYVGKFKALIEAMLRSKDQPKGSLLLQDHQFWGHFQLGAHSAEVYANFLPPDEGGMIRVRYQEWGYGYDNQTRLYYIARLLQKTGFHVEQDNGFLTAVVDKDHASQSVDEMTDTFALVIQALHATVGVDFALPLLVEERRLPGSRRAHRSVGGRRARRGDSAVHHPRRTYRHGGGLERVPRPVRGARRLRAGARPHARAPGPTAIPAGEALGQRTIDRFVNAPVAAALARGELRMSKKGDVDRVPKFERALGRRGGPDARPGPAAARAWPRPCPRSDPGLLPFETVGSLGALTVERAERRLEPKTRLAHRLRPARSEDRADRPRRGPGLRP